MTESNEQVAAFIQRWRGVTASELFTAQSFVNELCELLGVDRPHAAAEQDHMFERPVTFAHGDGGSSPGRVDCYRRGAFIWESRKLKPGVAAAATGQTSKRLLTDMPLRVFGRTGQPQVQPQPAEKSCLVYAPTIWNLWRTWNPGFGAFDGPS